MTRSRRPRHDYHGLVQQRSSIAEATVQYRACITQIAPIQRHIQLRGGAILLSSPARVASALSCPQHGTATSMILLHTYQSRDSKSPNLPVPANQIVVPIGSRTLRIAHNHRLTFKNRATRDRWHQLVLASAYQEHDKLDRYAVVRKLGRGAGGSVYLVQDKLANQNSGEKHLYAMKILDKWTAFQTDETLDRVASERLALERFASSSFVLGLVDAFQTGRRLYLVTELAELGDLERIVRAQPHRRLRAGVVRRIMAEVVLGLEEMHMAGYVYRDLKESNILVRESGHVVLGDLGIVKELGAVVEPDDIPSRLSDGSVASTPARTWMSVVSSDSSDTTSCDGSERDSSRAESESWSRHSESIEFASRARSFSGTRRYMAPEMLSHRVNGYDGAVDMWALGVLTYRLLTGRYPFGNDLRGHSSSVLQLFHAIENEELTFPADMDNETTAFLRALLSNDVALRANVRQIKQHPWFDGLDWDKLRQEAEDDIPVTDVLALKQNALYENGMTEVTCSLANLNRTVRLPGGKDRLGDDLIDHMTELSEFFTPTDVWRRRRTSTIGRSRGATRLPELSGFGYVETAGRSEAFEKATE